MELLPSLFLRIFLPGLRCINKTVRDILAVVNDGCTHPTSQFFATCNDRAFYTASPITKSILF